MVYCRNGAYGYIVAWRYSGYFLVWKLRDIGLGFPPRPDVLARFPWFDRL